MTEDQRENANKTKRGLLDGFLTGEERVKAYLYYGGCMGAIAFFTLLIRWLVGIFKGFLF